MLTLLVVALASTASAVIRGGSQQSSTTVKTTHSSEAVWDTAPVAGSADGMYSQLGVANFTSGATGYAASTSATYDQVVEIQELFYNTTSKPIYSIIPSIGLPKSPGKQQIVTVSLRDANGGRVSQSTEVDVGDDRAILRFIPKTVRWRTSLGYHVSKISIRPDNILTDGSPILKTLPYRGAASFTFDMRVVIPGIQVNVEARTSYASQWATDFYASSGSLVSYRINIANDGNMALSNLAVSNTPPPGAQYIGGAPIVRYGGANASGVKSQRLPLTGFEVASPEQGSGVPLPSVSAGPYFSSLVSGDNTNLLPGEIATVDFSLRMPTHATVGANLSDTARVTPFGEAAIPATAVATVQPR